MNWRIAGSVLAVILLVGYGVALLQNRRTTSATASTASDQWSLSTLLLASALTLFVELALIRWVATEVRIFAYAKNLALLLCFLGFGLGCALAPQAVRWPTAGRALIGLILIVRQPWRSGQVMEKWSQSLGAGQDVQIWGTGVARDWAAFLLAASVTTLLLWLITSIFIPLGQTVSRQIELAPRPLYAYSWNLAGSLAGVLAFFAVSWMALPPWVWFVAVLTCMAVLQVNRQERLFLVAAAVPVALLLYDPSTEHDFQLWTPYQLIEVHETFLDGEPTGAYIRVNHTGYQWAVNLSPDFLGRHPGLLAEPQDENPYNLPFRFTPAHPKVLIVGSGTGNDVAAALRNGSRAVDAVEIDPAILALGRRHPEHPYDDPRVTVHLTDARAFMKRVNARYDLILFGLLDSHTLLSDYSNMRIDNFVYTEESFREARALLAPKGVIFVKFQVNLPWLGRRLAEMLTRTVGKSPTVFTALSTFTAGATCFAISPSGQVDERLAADAGLRRFVDAHRPTFLDLPPATVTTDDWPYLYHQGHWIPGIFFLLSFLVVLLAAGFYFRIPEARSRVPSLFFFSMGAGFLLLETQVVSRLALYFGTTWQVNGIVIASLLGALLVANYVIENQRQPWPRAWTLAGILLGIVFAYLVPFDRLPGPAVAVGAVAAVVFALPIFFAGLLFASEFRVTDSPGAALAANMLGAVVGGLTENLSLITGMKALLLVAAVLYTLAGVGFPRLSQRTAP